MRARPGPLVLAVGLLLATGAPAQAQGIGQFQSGDKPLEITANNGIEWHRNEKLYIARGNARAAQGELAVLAEVLTARYRTGADGSTEIYRLEADGDVRMVSTNETITADKGVYDLDKGVLVLTGDNLKLETTDSVITARDSLEYWEEKQIAVARGDAIALREDTELRADVLTAYFKPDAEDKLAINTVRADGGVEIMTPEEFATGDTGIYYVTEELATLTGQVKITRGDNQLNGAYAEVNLKTGVSRLLAAPPGASGGGDNRVRGLLLPEAEDDGAPKE
ncbi:MAG: LptA/OstA family protein [Pseudomonadota bacterium]